GAKSVAVGVAFRIATRSGVSIPVPGSSDTAAGFQNPGRKPEPVAQGDELIEAGKPRTNDQGIERSAWRPTVCRISHHARHRCCRAAAAAGPGHDGEDIS